ncbi:MAG: hypothetical protein M1828_002576 [Chrysothrix sp. TS-e1954]|nr:MAG: hypothetical protein M1828_002576 [Chrysothrix sp. TS-e1954]
MGKAGRQRRQTIYQQSKPFRLLDLPAEIRALILGIAVKVAGENGHERYVRELRAIHWSEVDDYDQWPAFNPRVKVLRPPELIGDSIWNVWDEHRPTSVCTRWMEEEICWCHSICHLYVVEASRMTGRLLEVSERIRCEMIELVLPDLYKLAAKTAVASMPRGQDWVEKLMLDNWESPAEPPLQLIKSLNICVATHYERCGEATVSGFIPQKTYSRYMRACRRQYLV